MIKNFEQILGYLEHGFVERREGQNDGMWAIFWLSMRVRG
jgi:hypothetical protein